MNDTVRLLYIEDDAKDYLLLRDMLNAIPHSRYQLDWVTTYEEGLTALRNAAHDVYLVDYVLSGEKPDGLRLLKEVFPHGCTVPVIVLTAHGRYDVDAAALNLGVSDYLDKVDMRPAILERMIRYAIQQKRTEAQLRDALSRAEELNELKSRFISTVSHEFRTPLSIIRAMAYLIRATLPLEVLDGEKVRSRFATIDAQIGHMTSMLEDVLAYSRVEAGKPDFVPVQIDIGDWCRTLFTEIQDGIEDPTRLVYETDSVPLVGQADKRLLRHLVNNLLDNALKYSPAEAPVVIRVTRDDGMVCIEVRDKGIGIPEADLPHLFEPFHRAENVGAAPGSGLGLVIVKKSVELHGGRIEFNSEEGVGTTVHVWLPLLA